LGGDASQLDTIRHWILGLPIGTDLPYWCGGSAPVGGVNGVTLTSQPQY
jgi:hypothetical protein